MSLMRTQTGLSQTDLSRYISEISQYDLLSPEEERALAVEYYENEDVDAARQLVLGNLRFALKVALEYRRFAPVMDLVQEANLGLMEAVRRFNPYRGYRLITYAVWWIRAYLQRFVVENSSVVRRGTTRDQRKAARKLAPLRDRLEQSQGQSASTRELAEELDVSEEAIMAVTSSGDVSLDVPLGEGEDSASMRDFIEDEEADPERLLIEGEQTEFLKRAFEDVMETLSERDREIMQMRLLNADPVTLQELADQFDISRERVRQIESSIKKKVRAAVHNALEPPTPVLPPGEN